MLGAPHTPCMLLEVKLQTYACWKARLDASMTFQHKAQTAILATAGKLTYQ